MRKRPGQLENKIPDFVTDGESAHQVSNLSEEQLDTSTMFNDKLAGVSRRDFMRISKMYGLTATYFAAAAMGGVFSSEALAQKARSVYKRRYAKKAKHTLKLGSVSGWDHNKIIRLGTYHFARDVEERTNGEIQIEVLGSNSVCAEQVCIQKTIQGVIDIGTSSTQNASSVAPWLNALDFPYMFQSSGQIYNFFFNPASEKLFRKVYCEKYRMELLFSLCEMRNLYMGQKWKNKPPITKIGDLAGTKNRVTNTQLGRIAMQLMQLNPVPVAWVETLDSLKNGLIDGMETWTTATTAFNMAPVVSQYVGLKFIPGTGHTAMNVRKLDSLGSALGEEIREAAYYAQQQVMYSNEAGLVLVSGEVPNPGKDTIFGKAGTQMNFFSDAALAECEDIASPKRKEYDRWHEKLAKLGGYDVYKTLLPVVREYDKKALAIDVEPRRWWRSA